MNIEYNYQAHMQNWLRGQRGSRVLAYGQMTRTTPDLLCCPSDHLLHLAARAGSRKPDTLQLPGGAPFWPDNKLSRAINYKA